MNSNATPCKRSPCRVALFCVLCVDFRPKRRLLCACVRVCWLRSSERLLARASLHDTKQLARPSYAHESGRLERRDPRPATRRDPNKLRPPNRREARASGRATSSLRAATTTRRRATKRVRVRPSWSRLLAAEAQPNSAQREARDFRSHTRTLEHSNHSQLATKPKLLTLRLRRAERRLPTLRAVQYEILLVQRGRMRFAAVIGRASAALTCRTLVVGAGERRANCEHANEQHTRSHSEARLVRLRFHFRLARSPPSPAKIRSNARVECIHLLSVYVASWLAV